MRFTKDFSQHTCNPPVYSATPFKSKAHLDRKYEDFLAMQAGTFIINTATDPYIPEVRPVLAGRGFIFEDVDGTQKIVVELEDSIEVYPYPLDASTGLTAKLQEEDE